MKIQNTNVHFNTNFTRKDSKNPRELGTIKALFYLAKNHGNIINKYALNDDIFESSEESTPNQTSVLNQTKDNETQAPVEKTIQTEVEALDNSIPFDELPAEEDSDNEASEDDDSEDKVSEDETSAPIAQNEVSAEKSQTPVEENIQTKASKNSIDGLFDNKNNGFPENAQERRVNPETQLVLNLRLDKILRKYNLTDSALNKNLKYAVCTLKPETIDAIKDSEILFYLVGEEDEVSDLFRKDTLNTDDRIKKIYKIEEIFSKEDLESIPVSGNIKEKYNPKKESLLRWLLAFNSVEKDSILIEKVKKGDDYDVENTTPSIQPQQEVVVQKRIFNTETRDHAKPRLKKFISSHREYRNSDVNNDLYNALCTLNPETVDSIRDNEALFFMVANGEILEGSRGYIGLEGQRPMIESDRCRKIFALEDTFTPKELKQITDPDDENSKIFQRKNFYRWLFEFHSANGDDRCIQLAKHHVSEYVNMDPNDEKKLSILDRIMRPHRHRR